MQNTVMLTVTTMVPWNCRHISPTCLDFQTEAPTLYISWTISIGVTGLCAFSNCSMT